jgi:hypothetical protein
MADDPKRLFVEMVARISRETQVHMDERHHHFEFTDKLLYGLSAVLLILATFNVYYIYVLYQNLDGIVYNMMSMQTHLEDVNRNMQSITDDVASFDLHMKRMDRINENTAAIADNMPAVTQSMSKIGGEMVAIEDNMGRLSADMTNVDARFGQMTGGVTNMRQSVNQVARPMGFMGNFMP